MPSDLTRSADDPTIDVIGRNDARFPFSRGIMATSFLATGLKTDRAYQIASEIQQALHARPSRSIGLDDLIELASQHLADQAGPEVARRYLAWRRAKRSGRSVIIVLSGAPGVGKSTLATRLALRLGLNHVVTSDTIREVLRTVISENVLPELHVSTYETVRDLARPVSPLDSFHRQARAVGSATAAVARRFVSERRSALFEGVHLLPGDISRHLANHPASPIVVELLLTLPDRHRHESQLLKRAAAEPDRNGSRHLEHLDTIRALQDMLQHDARRAGVHEYDVGELSDLTQFIVDQVVARDEPAIQPAGAG